MRSVPSHFALPSSAPIATGAVILLSSNAGGLLFLASPKNWYHIIYSIWGDLSDG